MSWDETVKQILKVGSADIIANCKTDEEINAAATKHGLRPIGTKPAKGTLPSNTPECDVCGSPGATSRCTACASAYYCSKECQLHHWKKGGHKQKCKTLKDECERVGKMVSEACAACGADCSHDHLLTVVNGFRLLEAEGAYLAAVRAGLLDGLRLLLQGEPARCLSWRNGSVDVVSATQFVLCELFRGQRRSRNGTGSFGKMDVGRCAAFARSHPEAWFAWIGGVVAVTLAACDRRVVGISERRQAEVFRIARDCLCCLNIALYKREVPAAVFLYGDGGGDGKGWTAESAARVKATAKLLKRALDAAASSPKSCDPNRTLEGNLNEIVGALAYWADALGGDEAAFEREFKLKGKRLATYRGFGKLLAVATIRKGRTLTMKETQAVMQAFGDS